MEVKYVKKDMNNNYEFVTNLSKKQQMILLTKEMDKILRLPFLPKVSVLGCGILVKVAFVAGSGYWFAKKHFNIQS